MHPDKKFLDLALILAQESFLKGEVPIGAVVVSQTGEVLGSGRNSAEERGCQIFHAEVIAILQATQKIGTWRLNGCYLYSTLEPCKMCMGLALYSRLDGIYFGTLSPGFGELSGASGSTDKLVNKRTKIICSLQEVQCADILKRFFNNARSRRGYPNMSLDKVFLEKVQAKLLKMREEVLTIAQPTNIEDGSAPDSKIKDSADEASSMTMQMLQDAISNTGVNELKAIDQAIAKIKTGTYGQCQDCLLPIPEKRLEFFPYAIRCVSCQQKQDS